MLMHFRQKIEMSATQKSWAVQGQNTKVLFQYRN